MHDDSETQVYRLTPANPSVVRLAQLTDCHILADAQDCLKGMNTRASFEAVCDALMSKHADLDLLLATGDLSQDASSPSYRYLAQRFDELRRPVFWLPGNHDDVESMRAQLRGEWIFAHKQLLVGNWLIVLLDSTVAGETGGQLSTAQLEFLDASLRANANLHALVCLHHQALPAGSEWIDRLGLAQSERLGDTLRSHPNVRAVLWGHVHQQAHQRIDGIEWMSTPSTCVQFKPGSKTFALDDLAPGYRRIELHADGSIVTEVHRLGQGDFNARE
jgi:3',5'-cyclic-AMP phosphodiesterase